MAHFPVIGHQALRRGRRSVASQYYLLTTVAAQREPWFVDPITASLISAAHSDPDLFLGASCHSWVLMPDHWHGVIELRDGCELAKTMNRFKSTTAALVNRRLGRYGPVWSKAYHDRALRNEFEIAAAFRYIAMNPVHAGLCTHPHDHAHGLYIL